MFIHLCRSRGKEVFGGGVDDFVFQKVVEHTIEKGGGEREPRTEVRSELIAKQVMWHPSLTQHRLYRRISRWARGRLQQ